MDFISALVSAIATAEGWFHPDPKARPRRNNNPGNLRISPFTRKSEGETGNKMAAFDSPEAGVAALYWQVSKRVAEGKTLRELISSYAPAADGNDTNNYLAETLRRLDGVDPDRKLWFYLRLERIQ